jgi:hypothetical protein
MKNLHLVPVNVQDIAEKLAQKYISENERSNYILRLEAIRDYCEDALRKSNNKISAVPFKKVRR